MSTKQTIVIAWTVQTHVHDGRAFAADLGERPGMIAVTEPRACVWLNEGDGSDVKKATTYCARENANLGEGESDRVVFVYHMSIRDAIAKAKRDVLKVG